MAYNDNDVTSLKGAFSGPIFRFPAELDRSKLKDGFDPIAEGGIYLGEMHTDGIENEESADSNPVTVWSGRKLRTVYTNWSDILTTNLVSKLDADVSRAIYGENNVTVTADGTVIVKHGLRQPPVSSIVVCAVADDGRNQWFFAPRAQPDINISQTWNETDLVSLPVAWGLLEDAEGGTHYEYTLGQAS